MAFTPRQTKRTVERVEFYVPDGSTAKDLEDAVSAVRRAVLATPGGGERAQYDDVFFVRADDEGIVLWFDVEKRS